MEIQFTENFARKANYTYKWLTLFIYVLIVVLSLHSCNTEKTTKEVKIHKVDFNVLKKSLKSVEMKDSCHKKWMTSKEVYGELIDLEKERLKRRFIGKYLTCLSDYFLETGLDTIWVDGVILAPPSTYKIKEPVLRVYRYYYR